jgi:hypothetical protein
MHRSLALFAVILAASAGCRHDAAKADVAALLVDPTPATRAELRNALADALGAVPTLAADALTQTSVLVIDRAAPRGDNGALLRGRTLESSTERFQLVTNGGRCVLVRTAPAWRMPLPSARCVPESSANRLGS